MDYIAFKDWRSYHNYKAGPNARDDPPWIKLHRSLLYDYEFTQLTGLERGQLVSLLMMAMATSNKIPADPIWIAQRCLLSEPIELSRFDHWLETPYRLRTGSVRKIRGDKIRGDERRGVIADPPKKTASPVGPAPDMLLIEKFKELHFQVLRNAYVPAYPRDRKALKPQIKARGPDLIGEMIEAFWREQKKYQTDRENNWTGRARPDIPGFVHSIPNLIRDYEFDNKAVAQ